MQSVLTSSGGNRAAGSLVAQRQLVLHPLFRQTCVGAVREVGLVLESPALQGETSGSFRVNKPSVLPHLVNTG